MKIIISILEIIQYTIEVNNIKNPRRRVSRNCRAARPKGKTSAPIRQSLWNKTGYSSIVERATAINKSPKSRAYNAILPHSYTHKVLEEFHKGTPFAGDTIHTTTMALVAHYMGQRGTTFVQPETQYNPYTGDRKRLLAEEGTRVGLNLSAIVLDEYNGGDVITQKLIPLMFGDDLCQLRSPSSKLDFVQQLEGMDGTPTLLHCYNFGVTLEEWNRKGSASHGIKQLISASLEGRTVEHNTNNHSIEVKDSKLSLLLTSTPDAYYRFEDSVHSDFSRHQLITIGRKYDAPLMMEDCPTYTVDSQAIKTAWETQRSVRLHKVYRYSDSAVDEFNVRYRAFCGYPYLDELHEHTLIQSAYKLAVVYHWLRGDASDLIKRKDVQLAFLQLSSHFQDIHRAHCMLSGEWEAEMLLRAAKECYNSLKSRGMECKWSAQTLAVNKRAFRGQMELAQYVFELHEHQKQHPYPQLRLLDFESDIAALKTLFCGTCSPERLVTVAAECASAPTVAEDTSENAPPVAPEPAAVNPLFLSEPSPFGAGESDKSNPTIVPAPKDKAVEATEFKSTKQEDYMKHIETESVKVRTVFRAIFAPVLNSHCDASTQKKFDQLPLIYRRFSDEIVKQGHSERSEALWEWLVEAYEIIHVDVGGYLFFGGGDDQHFAELVRAERTISRLRDALEEQAKHIDPDLLGSDFDHLDGLWHTDCVIESVYDELVAEAKEAA